MGRRPALVALCALALAGCGGDEPETAGPGLSADEVRWVRAFAGWADDVGQAMADAQAAHEQALSGDASWYARALRPLRECSSGLDRRVPEAPTRRLRPIADSLERTCAAYERFARSQAASLRGDPGVALLRAQEAEARGDELLISAFERIGKLLRDNRRLPRTRGGQNSRVDPLYSSAASELAYERVEVRCWSEAEWPYVIRERRAFSNGYLNVHETLGFAWPDDRRAHLAPDICASLDGFSLDGEQGRAEELATAIVVLAHEVGHLRAPTSGEAEVECRAVQEARGLAVELGATAAEADELVDLYWREVYPDADEIYHSTQCHPSGYLDFDPANPRWP